MTPFVVLVSGPPGSGKTTLAADLADRLSMPMIAKDDLKESLFDSLGWSDVAWSRKLGAAVWELLFLLFERLVAGGASFIMESNFHVEQRERFLLLRDRFPFRSVEVHCTASADVLEHRFYNRERHPGHADDREIDFSTLNELHAPLDLDVVIDVDTNDEEAIDLDAIIERIRAAGENR